MARPETGLSPEAEASMAGIERKLEMALEVYRDAAASKAQREADEAATAIAKANLELALVAAKKDKQAAERALTEAKATITRLRNEARDFSASASAILNEALDVKPGLGVSTVVRSDDSGPVTRSGGLVFPLDDEDDDDDDEEEVKQE